MVLMNMKMWTESCMKLLVFLVQRAPFQVSKNNREPPACSPVHAMEPKVSEKGSCIFTWKNSPQLDTQPKVRDGQLG